MFPCGHSSAAATPVITAAAPNLIVRPAATFRRVLMSDPLSQTCIAVALLWQMSSWCCWSRHQQGAAARAQRGGHSAAGEPGVRVARFDGRRHAAPPGGEMTVPPDAPAPAAPAPEVSAVAGGGAGASSSSISCARHPRRRRPRPSRSARTTHTAATACAAQTATAARRRAPGRPDVRRRTATPLWLDLHGEPADERVRARQQRLRVPLLLGGQRTPLLPQRRAERTRRLDVVAQLERAHADAAQCARGRRLLVRLPEERARLLEVAGVVFGDRVADQHRHRRVVVGGARRRAATDGDK